MDYRIFPPEQLIEGSVSLPLSKSISNRAIILNALTKNPQPLPTVAACDDTDSLLKALADTSAPNINIGAAGTAMRFLTAFYAATDGTDVILDGSERMRRRPIAVLVDALRSLGADIQYTGLQGFPPLHIKGTCLDGGQLTVKADISSQYISALMMIGPVMTNGLHITLDGEIISTPYIRMTAAMMRQAGVNVDIEGNTISIPHTSYNPGAFQSIEADWSAASYWYEIEALSSGFISLSGLHPDSIQGDAKVSSYFDSHGVCTIYSDQQPDLVELQANPDQAPRISFDMSGTPDLAQTIAVTCAMLGIPFSISGLSTLRIKETDRIEALRVELLKLGVILQIDGEITISWDGRRRPITSLPEFDTYNDHRMAMAFAPVALYIPGIVIRDAEVVSKSSPEFWDHLRSVGFEIIDAATEPQNDNPAS